MPISLFLSFSLSYSLALLRLSLSLSFSHMYLFLLPACSLTNCIDIKMRVPCFYSFTMCFLLLELAQVAISNPAQEASFDIGEKMLIATSIILCFCGVLQGMAGLSLIKTPVPDSLRGDDGSRFLDGETQSEAIASGRFTGIRNVAWAVLLLSFSIHNLVDQKESSASLEVERRFGVALISFVFSAVQAADVAEMLYDWPSARPQRTLIASAAAMLALLALVAGVLAIS